MRRFDLYTRVHVRVCVCVLVSAAVRAGTVSSATASELVDIQRHAGDNLKYTDFLWFSYDFGWSLK